MSASNTKTCAPRTVAAAAILMVEIWGKQLHVWIVSVGLEFMRLRCARCATPAVPQGLMKGLIEHAFSFLPMIASIDQFRQLIGAIMRMSPPDISPRPRAHGHGVHVRFSGTCTT